MKKTTHPFIAQKLITSGAIHPLSHICIHDMQKEWTITYLMHLKTSTMPEEGRNKHKIKVWGVNLKIFVWHLSPSFYKSHHPVHIQMQETKRCATPTILNSHDMNNSGMWELSCGYFTGLNKTMLSKVTKFLNMHELFKKNKLPQWPISPTQNLTSISVVWTDLVQYKRLPQCTIFYAITRASNTHFKTTLL
jgi:hypothetical protein